MTVLWLTVNPIETLIKRSSNHVSVLQHSMLKKALWVEGNDWCRVRWQLFPYALARALCNVSDKIKSNESRSSLKLVRKNPAVYFFSTARKQVCVFLLRLENYYIWDFFLPKSINKEILSDGVRENKALFIFMAKGTDSITERFSKLFTLTVWNDWKSIIDRRGTLLSH